MINFIRKRPRITLNNSRHVNDVWDDCGTKDIFIPYLINNYKHCMGSVDVVDQRISDYIINLHFYLKYIPTLVYSSGSYASLGETHT